MATNQKKADVQDFYRRSATYENSRSQGYIFDRVQRTVLDLAKNGKKPRLNVEFQHRRLRWSRILVVTVGKKCSLRW